MIDPRPTPAILAPPQPACPPDSPPSTSPPDDPRASRDGKTIRPAGARAEEPEVGRLALRIEEIATALGVSRRAIEREKSAGRLPKPDRVIGRMPLWRVETIRAWLGGNGR